MPAPTPVRSPLPEAWDDLLGMLLSCLCAVHCAATVLFVSTLTTVGLAGMADPRVERAMLVVAMVVGGACWGTARWRTVATGRWCPSSLAC